MKRVWIESQEIWTRSSAQMTKLKCRLVISSCLQFKLIPNHSLVLFCTFDKYRQILFNFALCYNPLKIWRYKMSQFSLLSSHAQINWTWFYRRKPYFPAALCFLISWFPLVDMEKLVTLCFVLNCRIDGSNSHSVQWWIVRLAVCVDWLILFCLPLRNTNTAFPSGLKS